VLDETTWLYIWRWGVFAIGAGIAVGALTALFLGAGVPAGAAPVFAMGLVMPPVLVASSRMRGRSGSR
jgi:hypothetical protein